MYVKKQIMYQTNLWGVSIAALAMKRREIKEQMMNRLILKSAGTTCPWFGLFDASHSPYQAPRVRRSGRLHSPQPGFHPQQRNQQPAPDGAAHGWGKTHAPFPLAIGHGSSEWRLARRMKKEESVARR
jgi:hypothetical protein